MLSALYLMAVCGAVIAAGEHADLIAAGKPIRHSRWLMVYIAVGLLFSVVLVQSWWLPLALIGEAGTFSLYFRLLLNRFRGLPAHYMGPGPGDTSARRSQYDLLCWRIGKAIGRPPVFVALTMEAVAAVGAPVLFVIFRP